MGEDGLDVFAEEYAAGPCFPPGKAIFRVFDLTPVGQVNVVILGHDPYHTPGAAMGLCLSVPDGHPPQPSLQNIFKELSTDVGVARADLSDWAEQGVFLLNSVLTVRAGAAGSHAAKGREKLTDSAIRHLSTERQHLVFILWGGYAQTKRSLIDPGKHLVLTAPHPSPLSASKRFLWQQAVQLGERLPASAWPGGHRLGISTATDSGRRCSLPLSSRVTVKSWSTGRRRNCGGRRIAVPPRPRRNRRAADTIYRTG